MDTITLSVTGMMCDACVGHVTRALSGLAGVEKADISLASNTATVVYDPAQVTLEQMTDAIADEGYEVGG